MVCNLSSAKLCNEQILRVHFLLLQSFIRPIPTQVILLWKGPPKFWIECHLVSLRAFPPKSPGRMHTLKENVKGYTRASQTFFCSHQN